MFAMSVQQMGRRTIFDVNPTMYPRTQFNQDFQERANQVSSAIEEEVNDLYR